MSEIKVTKRPLYSIEKRKDGKIQGKYTVEINGDTFTSYCEANTEGEAFSLLKTRYSKALKNSKYGDSLPSGDLDGILGTPTRSRPGQIDQRQKSAEQANAAFSGEESDEVLDEILEAGSDIMTKGIPRNHIPFQVTPQGIHLDGLGGVELKEPNPELFERPGDKVIRGKNNTSITLGRDHSPDNEQVYSKNSANIEYNTRLSDHMGAGAIDIVVGRMSPFALEKLNNEPIVVAPSFNTSYPPILATQQLEGGRHPGIHMDAARIYISQMTTIDENFKITKKIRPGDKVPDSAAPTSGIMLKADKVRLHSRQDIKIVTGGPNEKHNSQGNYIKQNNGIHLIAQNGKTIDGIEIPQQPMVLGDNLVECLQGMFKLISDVSQRLDSFVQAQSNFNAISSTAFHLIPVPSAITVPNPQEVWAGMVSTLESLNNRLDAFKTEINNFTKQTNYLKKTGEKSITSDYNTVN